LKRVIVYALRFQATATATPRIELSLARRGARATNRSSRSSVQFLSDRDRTLSNAGIAQLRN
jgi:hypothetical protein